MIGPEKPSEAEEQNNTPEQNASFPEWKERDKDEKYHDTKAYFELRLEEASVGLKKASVELDEEKEKGKKGNKTKIERLKDEISHEAKPAKKKYEKILDSLENGDTEPAEKEIKKRRSRLEKEIKSKERKNADKSQEQLAAEDEDYKILLDDYGSLLEALNELTELTMPHEEVLPETVPPDMKETVVGASETRKGFTSEIEPPPPAESLEKPALITPKASKPPETPKATEPQPGTKPAVEILDDKNVITKEQGASVKEIIRKAEKSAEEEFQKLVDEGKAKTKEQFSADTEGPLAEKLWVGRYNEFFSKLSEKEQEGLLGLRSNHKVLDEKAVEDLFASGFSLEEIKNITWDHWWSRKINSKLSDKPETDSDFDKLVEEQINQKKRELLKNEWENKRQALIDQRVAEELKRAEELERAKAEDEKKTETSDAEQKISDEEKKEQIKEKLTPEEKLKELSELRGKWNNAQKIDKALRAGKYKCKTESGEILSGEEGKKEMEKRKGELSDEIINIADRLSGKNLRKEALAVTGYDPKNPDAEKQKQFRKYLTQEVQKAYAESAKELERSSGKKLKIKKSEKLLQKQEELKPAEIEKETVQAPVKPKEESAPVLAESAEAGFIRVIKEFDKDLRIIAGYFISAKIHHGETFKEVAEDKQGVEMYRSFNDRGKNMPDRLKNWVGPRADKKLSPFWYKDTGNNPAIYLGPVKMQKIETKQEMRETKGFLGFGKKQELVEVKTGTEVSATLKDCGVSGEHESEELSALSILYINYSGEGSGYNENRPGVETKIEFVMRKSLAAQILEEIKKDPNNLDRFIRFVEPKLLEVTSPIGLTNPSRIAVYNEYEEKIDRNSKPTEFIEAK